MTYIFITLRPNGEIHVEREDATVLVTTLDAWSKEDLERIFTDERSGTKPRMIGWEHHAEVRFVKPCFPPSAIAALVDARAMMFTEVT